MFMRVSRVQSSPDHVLAEIANFGSVLVPSIRGLPGYLGASLLVDKRSGAWASVTYWENGELLHASVTASTALQMLECSDGSAWDTEDFEVILHDGSVPQKARGFVRLHDLQGSAANLDESITFLREELIPALKSHRGFEAVLVGVSLQRGRALVASMWTTLGELLASDQALADLRRHSREIAGAGAGSLDVYYMAGVKPPA